MEHIVQFAIGVDDEAIAARVSANAEKVIIDQLSEEVRKEFFEIEPWRDNRICGVQVWVHRQFDEFLEANKELIVNLAAERLADRLSRTKAAKEAVQKVVEQEV